MTTVAVFADPPIEGFVLESLPEDVLDESESTALYAAMLADVCRAVEASGGELLVNYRPADHVPERANSERAIREVLSEALADPDAARYEVQVGSSYAARVGNTITHLIEQEDVTTAAAVDPTAALLARQTIDSAAMKLRSADVVLGPATDGRVYYAGFAEPIDFEDAYATPTVETLAARAGDAGLDVDFLPVAPVVDTTSDLRTVVSLLRSHRQSGHTIGPRTTTLIEEFGLRVEGSSDGPALVRGDS